MRSLWRAKFATILFFGGPGGRNRVQKTTLKKHAGKGDARVTGNRKSRVQAPLNSPTFQTIQTLRTVRQWDSRTVGLLDTTRD